MLRGSHTARVDEKGRIKIPSPYRHYIEEHYGTEFYVTSVTGESALLYPMQEWLTIEESLQAKGTMDLSVRKFLDRTNYFGQVTELDKQGRILVHPMLRSEAELSGDVTVMGYLQFMEVWSLDRFKARLDRAPYTDEDAATIAKALKGEG
jgi:MraZ protein